jgi:hypothetical protein
VRFAAAAFASAGTMFGRSKPLDIVRKNAERDALAAACAARCSARALVNSRAGNIFNGFERVPVNEKIPALNSI